MTPMKRKRRTIGRIGIAMLAAVLLAAGLPWTSRVGAEPAWTPELVRELRQGGFILYSRHGEAGIGSDQANPDFDDCSTQRNLTATGRRQAASYGQALRTWRIPVRLPASTSPFCRTRETARLAFGAGGEVPDPFWLRVYRLSEPGVTAAERQATLDGLKKRLERKPPPGVNWAIVSHSFPAGVGLGEIPSMGTVVIRPKGPGRGYEIVAKVPLEEMLNRMP